MQHKILPYRKIFQKFHAQAENFCAVTNLYSIERKF